MWWSSFPNSKNPGVNIRQSPTRAITQNIQTMLIQTVNVVRENKLKNSKEFKGKQWLNLIMDPILLPERWEILEKLCNV